MRTASEREKALYESLAASPITKECHGRYCVEDGPFIEQRLVIQGELEYPIVASCAVCNRYVCSECALKPPSDPEDPVGGYGLECRYCGELLGDPAQVLHVSADMVNRSMSHRAAQTASLATMNELWIDFYQSCLRRGLFDTPRLRKAAALRADEKWHEALAELRQQEAECREAAYLGGMQRCQIERERILYMLKPSDMDVPRPEPTARWRQLLAWTAAARTIHSDDAVSRSTYKSSSRAIDLIRDLEFENRAAGDDESADHCLFCLLAILSSGESREALNDELSRILSDPKRSASLARLETDSGSKRESED